MSETFQPNIAVIVITYNSENTVLETLESIYAQTYKNIELTVSDDNSKDATLEVVNGWLESRQNRFIDAKVIKSPTNTGVAGNCNRGVRQSNSEYYKLIAGDDLLEKNAIEKYVDFAKKNPDKIGVAKVTPFGDVNKEKLDIWETVFAKGYKKLEYSFRKKYRKLVVRNYICAPAVGVIKRGWYDKVNGFSEEYPFCEDHPMYIKLMEAGYDFLLIDDFLVKYRVSEGALSGGASPLLISSTIRYFKKEKMLKLLKIGEIPELIAQVVLYGYLHIKMSLKNEVVRVENEMEFKS